MTIHIFTDGSRGAVNGSLGFGTYVEQLGVKISRWHISNGSSVFTKNMCLVYVNVGVPRQ